MEATAVSTEAVNGTPAEPITATETPVSKLQALINERFGTTKADKTEEPAPEVEAKAEEVPEVKPEETKEEPPKRIELDLAKAQKEVKKLTSEHVHAKAELTKVTTELSGLKEAFSKNPLKALEQATGRSLKDIFEAGKRGDYDDKVAQLPEDVREKLSYIEQLQAKEREREEAAAKEAAKIQREQEFQAALPRVKGLIEADADKFPFLAATRLNAEQVLDSIYEKIDAGDPKPDVQVVFQELEDFAKHQAKFWLTQPSIIRLIAADEGTRTQMVEALGLDKQTPNGQNSSPADPTTPKVMKSVSTLSEVKSRQDNPTTEADRKREIAEEWARIRSAR